MPSRSLSTSGAGGPARFRVRIQPRSPRPGPDGRRDGIPLLRVAAPPVEGKANAEVEKVLTRLLGARARVVRGETGRLKSVEVALGSSELRARLAGVFGE